MSRTSPSPAATPGAASSVRHTRWLAAIIGGLFLLLVAGFIAMVVFVKDEVRINPVGPIAAAPGLEQGGLHFQGTLNVWELQGRMAIDARRQAHFELDMRGPSGQPAPRDLAFSLALATPDGSREPLRIPHESIGIGSYAASVQLPAPGRWQLRVGFPEVTGVLEFDAGR